MHSSLNVYLVEVSINQSYLQDIPDAASQGLEWGRTGVLIILALLASIAILSFFLSQFNN